MNSLLLAARFLDMEIPNFPSDYPPFLEQIKLYETECFCCINKALLVKYVRLQRLTLSGIYSWNKIFVVQSRPPALPVGFRFPRVSVTSTFVLYSTVATTLRLSITLTFATPISECAEVITNTRHGEPSLSDPSPSSPVTWHVAFWALLALALNSMAQPAGRICGHPSRYRIYLASSPIICVGRVTRRTE